jgi:Holliday junction DNA helicase RuvA
MIGYLRGKVVHIGEESCILDVNGVGYIVYCSAHTLQEITNCCTSDASELRLYTRLIHRDDTMDLYGFISRDEHILFNLLLTVSGIGPKQSIKILGTRNAPDIIRAVVSEDSSFLMAMSGIGKKKAQQIILELKEKVRKFFDTVHTPESTLYIDAIGALETLGFTPAESRNAVEKAMEEKGDGADIETLMEAALRHLS